MSISGRRTLTADIPMLDFAIPYAAPVQQRVTDMQQPISPKKDWMMVLVIVVRRRATRVKPEGHN